MTKVDYKQEKEVSLFERFRQALGDPELLSGTVRAGRVHCHTPGDQDQLNEPDVVCSLPCGSVRYFENVQLVPEELMELIHRPFLDYHKGRLLSKSEILVFETRYQGCYLAYDEPSGERLYRALKKVLRYLVHGEPAGDFATVNGQTSIPYEAIGDDGRISHGLLNRSWYTAREEIPQDPGITVTGPLFQGKPEVVPSAPSARGPAVPGLRKKCAKLYFDPASGLRICPELVLWSADYSGFSLEESADALDSPIARGEWESHFVALWLFDVLGEKILRLKGSSRPPQEDSNSRT